MSALPFLVEWAVRSSVLIAAGALLLWALRVRDASIRLAAWTALLACSLAIPALTAALPGLAFRHAEATTAAIFQTLPAPAPPVMPHVPPGAPPKSVDWPLLALAAYAGVALTLLSRVALGLALSLRLLRNSRATERVTDGVPIRESDRVAAPVTLGIVRPAIVLPTGWRDWPDSKLDAVLAHERSHILRRDPALQLLSALHRSVLWHSPLSWFLHRQIVRVAEDASDDAAIGVIGDRAVYARVLLDFLGGAKAPHGISMARYGSPERRIERVLHSAALSRGVSRWSVAAIVFLASPLAYVASAAHAQNQTPAPPARSEPQPAAVTPAAAPAPKPQAAPARRAAPIRIEGLGNVTASSTVVVRAQAEGQLMSLTFQEGQPVQAGQALGAIDPQTYEILLAEAQDQLARDEAELPKARSGIGPAQTIEAEVKASQAKVDYAKLQLAHTRITAPISGVAGFRMVDPGNFVHPGEPLVVITQIQPADVLFSVPEDRLPDVLSRLRAGTTLPVEAWNRDNSARLATGRLVAVDNTIDNQTGTAKLKAEFENKNGALFPNQFVNVRLFLNSQE